MHTAILAITIPYIKRKLPYNVAAKYAAQFNKTVNKILCTKLTSYVHYKNPKLYLREVPLLSSTHIPMVNK